MKEPVANPALTDERLVSLDFFRGLTMFLLTAESAEVFTHFVDPELEGTFLYWLGTQCHHVSWDGLRFWDLIQPFFMFIVGVAMPFSLAIRIKKGQTHAGLTGHALKRSLVLLLLGWGLYCIGPGEIQFRFQSVLSQLALTYMIAYLIMNQSVRFQLIFSLALVALTEIVYRGFWVEGFTNPFTAPNENFGYWLDLQYGGEDTGGHWVSFNALPTTAHTIWGVLAGQLLLSSRSAMNKLSILVVAGLLCLAAGYGLSSMTPIIKRISTSTFVLASGGWTLLALGFSYWLIDIMKQRKWTLFCVVVGMNPLFIYLFCNVGGAGMAEHIISPFATALLGGLGEAKLRIAISLLVLFLLWYLCYWLFKRKIFIKI